jgi:hypothetical protein
MPTAMLPTVEMESRLARIEEQLTRLANATPTAVAPRKPSRK